MALSPRRRRIVEQILPPMRGATYGTDLFRQIDTHWTPNCGYTTCGGLPTYVAKQLGMNPELAKEGLGAYGLSSMRDAAIKRNAWRHNGTTLRAIAIGIGAQASRPQPGDLYMLCSGAGHDTACNCLMPTGKLANSYKGGHIEHVGVIMASDGNSWTTMDAGQSGPETQQVLQMSRTYDNNTGFMTGEKGRAGKPMRRLCGWLDVDSYPFIN